MAATLKYYKYLGNVTCEKRCGKMDIGRGKMNRWKDGSLILNETFLIFDFLEVVM